MLSGSATRGIRGVKMEREKKREKKGGENGGKEKQKNIKRYMGGRVVLGTSCKMGRQPSLSLDSGMPS